MSKITVNGVAYDSVDAMPADARRMYEQAMAHLPELAPQVPDSAPEVVHGEGLTVQHRAVVRKKFVINGVTYDDERAMPPDARRVYEEAMRAARSGEGVRKREVRMSFEMSGPGFSFLKTFGPTSPPPSGPAGEAHSAPEPIVGTSIPPAIEPASTPGGARVALVLGACGAVGLVFWLLTRAR